MPYGQTGMLRRFVNQYLRTMHEFGRFFKEASEIDNEESLEALHGRLHTTRRTLRGLRAARKIQLRQRTEERLAVKYRMKWKAPKVPDPAAAALAKNYCRPYKSGPFRRWTPATDETSRNFSFIICLLAFGLIFKLLPSDLLARLWVDNDLMATTIPPVISYIRGFYYTGKLTPLSPQKPPGRGGF